MGFDDAPYSDGGSAREAAAEIYTLCFPLYFTDAVRRAHPISLSQFHLVTTESARLAPGLFEDDPRVVISSAWVDLSSGPVVLRIPHMHGRHFSMSVFDTTGRSVVSFGSRTGDDSGLDFVLVGPRWVGEIRRGVRCKRSTSESCWIVSRIHSHSMMDRGDTIALARRQSLAVLFYEAELREAADTLLEPTPATCLQQVLEMPPDQYFQRMGSILERAPVAQHGAEQTALTKLKAWIGGPRESENWSPELFAELTKGFGDAITAIQAAAGAMYTGQGVGWRTTLPEPEEPEAETPLVRAARAYVSLGAPPREDRLTFICDRDETGRLLSGGNAYRIRLSSAAMPPVHGFWRLYTRPEAAPQYRTGVGSRNDLLVNPDGSLDLTIQHPLPEVAGIANWLPAPEGELSLVMTLHSPRPAALKGVWRMPAVERLDPGSRQGRGRRRSGTGTARSPFSRELRKPLPEERPTPEERNGA